MPWYFMAKALKVLTVICARDDSNQFDKYTSSFEKKENGLLICISHAWS